MKKSLFLICILLTAGFTKNSEFIWVIGPMFHANFGHSKPKFSIAVEGSTWGSHFWGVDYGVEYEIGNAYRIYSEIETGYNYTGIGIGPVVQFGNENTGYGIQGSGWANYFLGADIRYRLGYRLHQTLAPGIYFKIPYSYPRISFESPDP
jgi:hypothetical protein